jgi:uncharacterized protein YkwD
MTRRSGYALGTPHMPRPRAYLVLGILVALLVTADAVPSQASGLRGRMLHSINRVRVNHHEHRLDLNLRLSHDAHRHSRRMANRGGIFHTVDLASRVLRFGARSWGENVAKAGTIRRTTRLWMASPSHRYNMLRSSYRRAGVGVVRARGWLWVTVMFYGR